MPRNSSSVSHAIANISQYRKTYGFSKALRAIIHYAFVAIKRNNLSRSNELIEVNGYKLSVMNNDRFGTSSELLMFKTHEPISTKLISKLLKKDMTCLDIGGNIGYYVLLENKLIGNAGKIIAIEPSPDNFKQMKKNIELQNTNIVDAYNIAAGDKDGKLKFLIYEDSSNSCMVIPEGEESRWPGEIIEVPVKKMDDLLNDLGITQVDFIRMDVEGYENHVIEGLQDTLRKSKPLIHMEVHVKIMGKENTKKFLLDFKNNDYEIIYYIPREIDTPIIGTLRDVKKYNIDKIISLLDEGFLPSFCMLTLAHKSKLENY